MHVDKTSVCQMAQVTGRILVPNKVSYTCFSRKKAIPYLWTINQHARDALLEQMSSFSSAYVQLVYSEKLLHLLGGRPNPGRRVLTPDLPQTESGVLTPTEFVSLLIPESPELQENWLRAPRPRPYGRIPLVEFQQMVEPPETAELNEAVPVAIAEVAESEAEVVESKAEVVGAEVEVLESRWFSDSDTESEDEDEDEDDSHSVRYAFAGGVTISPPASDLPIPTACVAARPVALPNTFVRTMSLYGDDDEVYIPNSASVGRGRATISPPESTLPIPAVGVIARPLVKATATTSAIVVEPEVPIVADEECDEEYDEEYDEELDEEQVHYTTRFAFAGGVTISPDASDLPIPTFAKAKRSYSQAVQDLDAGYELSERAVRSEMFSDNITNLDARVTMWLSKTITTGNAASNGGNNVAPTTDASFQSSLLRQTATGSPSASSSSLASPTSSTSALVSVASDSDNEGWKVVGSRRRAQDVKQPQQHRRRRPRRHHRRASSASSSASAHAMPMPVAAGRRN